MGIKKITKPDDLFEGARLRVYDKGSTNLTSYPDQYEYVLHKVRNKEDYYWIFTSKYTIIPASGYFNPNYHDWYIMNYQNEIFSDKEYEELWV